MEPVTVYAFDFWHRKRGEAVRAPRMATWAAIERLGGRIIRASATKVERRELDDKQFYPAKSSSSGCDRLSVWRVD